MYSQEITYSVYAERYEDTRYKFAKLYESKHESETRTFIDGLRDLTTRNGLPKYKNFEFRKMTKTIVEEIL
jgi:hypothetical protein